MNPIFLDRLLERRFFAKLRREARQAVKAVKLLTYRSSQFGLLAKSRYKANIVYLYGGQRLKRIAKKILQSMGVEVHRGQPKRSVKKNDSALYCRAIHVGCGGILADGYLNIDGGLREIFPEIRVGEAYSIDGKPDTFIMQFDLRRGLPIGAGKASILYHSHFFEHLTDEEGIVFIQDCYNCLAPSGIMRFAVPDFQLWATNYTNGDTDFFQRYRSAYLNNDCDRYPTNNAVFAGMIYSWGHRNFYDFETLHCILSRVGFTEIRAAKWGVSEKVDNIRFLESDVSERRFESLVVECSKPSIK